MYTVLEDFMNPRLGEFKTTMFVSGFIALEKHGDISAWSEVCTLLQHATDHTTTDLMDVTESVLNTGLEKALSAYTLIVEGDIRIKTEILTIIVQIDDFELKEAMYNLVSDYITPEECMCELLALVGGYPVEKYFPNIISISPTFFNTIIRNCTPSLEGFSEKINDTDKRRLHIVQAFIEKYPNSTASDAVTRDMVNLGTPIDALLEKYRERFAIFEPRAPAQAVLELIGLFILSDVPVESMGVEIKQRLDALFSEVSFVTAIHSTIDTKLMQVINDGQAPVFH